MLILSPLSGLVCSGKESEAPASSVLWCVSDVCINSSGWADGGHALVFVSVRRGWVNVTRVLRDVTIHNGPTRVMKTRS